MVPRCGVASDAREDERMSHGELVFDDEFADDVVLEARGADEVQLVSSCWGRCAFAQRHRAPAQVTQSRQCRRTQRAVGEIACLRDVADRKTCIE